MKDPCAPIPSDAHVTWTRTDGRPSAPYEPIPFNAVGADGKVHEIDHPAGRTLVADGNATVKVRDSFFDARLNIAKCRYQAAMKKQGKERRDDLTNAKQGIQSLARVYPDYGGATFKPQFEELLRNIKRDEENLPADTDAKK